MELDASQLAALRAELDADPAGLGYAGKTEKEVEALMAVVGGSTADTARRVLRDVIETWEIVGATVYGEYASLTATQRDLYGAIVACGRVNPQNVNIRTIFTQLFSAGATRTALSELQYRAGTRAENLFGSGVVVRYWDVELARAL